MAAGVMGLVRSRLHGSRDAGMTLVELMVAMGLFTVLLGVFMSGVSVMTDATVRTQAAADSSDEVRRAYQRLDKQLRYASAVNRPGIAGGNQYIEFQTTAVAEGNEPMCSQWRLNASADTLEFRTWPDRDTSVTASGWSTVASRVVNDPTSDPAFTFLAVDENHTKQRVAVFVDVQNNQGKGAELSSMFVALNTTPTTLTNEATTGGQSRYPVCQQVGRS